MGKIEKIKMKDFKSFRNAIIPFVDGFTTVVGPNGSGKSCEKNTKVLLATGEIKPIGELVNKALEKASETKQIEDGVLTFENSEEIEVLSLNTETMKMEKRPVTAFVRRSATEKLLKISTRTGKEVITTPCHPLIIFKNGELRAIKAEELKLGAFIATPRRINLMGSRVQIQKHLLPEYTEIKEDERNYYLKDRRMANTTKIKVPKTINCEFARFIGYLIGDGYIKRGGCEFVNSDRKLVGDFMRLSKKLFGINPKTRKAGNSTRVMLFSVILSDVLHALCCKKKLNSRTKNVPSLLLQSTNKVLSHFLAALLDCDGHVNKTKYTLEYTTASEDLKHQVQYILLRFGLISRSREEWKAATNTAKKQKRLYYRLYVDGLQSMKTILREIPLRHHAKSNQLKKFSKLKTKPYNTVDILPREVNEHIRALIRGLGIPIKKLRSVYPKLAAYNEDRCHPTREGIQELLPIFMEYSPKIGAVNRALVSAIADKTLLVTAISDLPISRQEVCRATGHDPGMITNSWVCHDYAGDVDNLIDVQDYLVQYSSTTAMQAEKEIGLLALIVESDILWDRIEKIEELTGEEHVYDLTVDGNHNFVAENMFVHNSNLNDAIMFVLGEGSMKSLRAGRLTDLVHHSSKSGEAEVTIELRENGDKYKIGRSIDKKGSSVYRLNEKRTTRTGLVELLATMQVPPEGHNIIMQGDVTSIINMTPKQRREVIDDISGIAEYNMKKDKALHELEKVDGKIKESDIILYERGGYLKEIKKERDEALRYKRFEGEKKQLKHTIIHAELKDVEAKYKDSSEKVAELQKDLDDLKHTVSKISAQVTNWENQLSALQKEIMAKGEKEQIEISKEVEQLKSRLSLIQEKIRSRKEDIRAAKQDMDKAKRLIAQSKEEGKEKREALVKLKKEDKSYDERIKEKDGELHAYMEELREKNLLVGDVTQKLEQLNEEIAKKKESFYEMKGKLDQIREKISVKKLSISDRSVEREESDKRLDELKEAFDSANKQFAEYKRGFRGFDQELEKLFAEEKKLNQELIELESELDTVREKYHALQSKVSTIRHMTGNMASDAIMKAKNELPGVIGRVEDLCSFDVEYANAIETAAGARMHFIVTKDSEAATKAVKWLKKRKLGRTTFIPLDRIKPVELSQESQNAMRNSKAIDFAIKLVKFKKEYHNVFSYVFGDTVIVEDIDAAKEIGFGSCRMATLDGDLAESSGAVTGGFKQGSLTLQEIKRVDELKEASENLQKKKGKMIRALDELREQMNYQRGQKAESELKVKEFETRVNELQKRIDEHKGITKKYSLSEEDIKKEIESFKIELIEGEKKLKEFQAEIHESEEKKEIAKEKIDSPEAKMVSQRLEEMQKRVQSLRDQRAEIIIQINSISAELDKFMMEREKAHEESIKDNEELSKGWQNEIISLQDEDKELQEKLKEKLVAEKEISSSIHGLVEKRDSLETEVRKLAEQRGQLQRQLETKQSQYNEENFKKAKWETKFTDLKSEFDETIKVKDFKMTVEEMQEEIEKLTNKMIRLEPINLAAVEKYDRYVAELDIMKEKAEKLREEKQSVLDLMEQIELKRKDAFVETFSEIRKHFGRIFKQFYPETDAQADIKLQNEAEPFEGGLLVEARPAGKQLKVIDAMSGGEKTLTALAFLFAVQAYKPSPFYILDEADAALDRPNSERLAQMIKEKADDSQFIVITHNNPMIHASDQIVGVSMNKKQGSSIVEVDLKRLEKSGEETPLK